MNTLDLASELSRLIPMLMALAIGLCLIKEDRRPRVCRVLVNGLPNEGSRINVATSWSNLRIGLLNHGSLDPTSGLLLRGSRSVHTRGMGFPIDIVFLSKSGKVLGWDEAVPPGRRRISGPKGTADVLELATGAAVQVFGLAQGAVLTFEVRA